MGCCALFDRTTANLPLSEVTIMKTKIRRYSRKSLSIVLAFVMMFTTLIAGSVSVANAAPNFYNYDGVKNFHLYYDDSKANISNGASRNVYFIIGHDSYSAVYSMTKIANTSLYYYNLTSEWTGATGFCFGSKSSAPTSGNDVSLDTCKNDCTSSTNKYTATTNFYGNNRTYYFMADSSKALSYTEFQTGSDNYSALKNNISLQTKQKNVGDSAYTVVNDTNIVIPHIKSGWWDGKSATLSTTGDSDASNGKVQYDNAVAAASTTFSYSSLQSDYEFVGWYNSSGTSVGTSSTYTFFQNGQRSNITYYGYYKQKYTVSVSSAGNGTATVGGSSSTTVSQGGSASIVATPSSGYALDYWEVTGGSITQTASNLTDSDTINPTGSTAAVSLVAHFKPSNFTVTVTKSGLTGGTLTTPSSGSYTGLNIGDRRSIVATPTSGTNYVFANWTASPAANIEFDDASSASTMFTAYGPATITPSFTQETLYSVSVTNGIDHTTTTVNAGNTINPTITAADLDSDEYAFTGWSHTGNVSLASGYSWSDSTIKVKATGSGGTVTANYSEYVYFYAALQSDWDSAPVVNVDGDVVAAHDWIADTDDTPLTLYQSGSSGAEIGGNGCNTYYIGIYRVPSTKLNTNVNVFNSSMTGTDADNGYCGKLQSGNGYCYYTYSDGTDQNHSGYLSRQAVTAATVSRTSPVDGDQAIEINVTETNYRGKTAGQDSRTLSYAAVNQKTGTVTALAEKNFTPDNINLPAGTYKFRVTSVDAATGKMTSSVETSNFVIRQTPNLHTVTVNAGTGASAASSNPRTYVYDGGSATAFTSGTDQIKTGSVITLKYTLKSGYKFVSGSGVTASGISASNITSSVSGSMVTLTFTLPDANCTVTYTPTEITHSITIKRRYYNSTGSTEIAPQTTFGTISGAGITTAVSTEAADSQTDYDFINWTLPSSGVTLKSGSLTSSDPITVNATVDDAVIYIDYRETMYTVTLKANDFTRGKVNNSSSQTTIQVGNVTPVQITASNNPGYYFDGWTKTAGSGTVTYGSGASSATTTIKTNGAVTICANFTPADYTVSVNWSSNGEVLSNAGNSFTVTPDHGQIGTSYTITVTLADGYEVDNISGSGLVANPTISTSGNTYTYTSKIGSVNVDAVINLKAKKPTLSKVQAKGNDSGFQFANVSNGGRVENYYKQPADVEASTDSFATLQFKIASGSYTAATSPYHANQPTITEPAIDGYTDYTVSIQAVNAKAGVTTAYSEVYTFTIRVKYNDAQKAYKRLVEFKNKLFKETAQDYYKSDAGDAISAYNGYYDVADAKSMPDYDDGSDVETSLTTLKKNLQSALETMLGYAKTTTVYVLTKYQQNNNSNYVNARVWGKSSDPNSVQWNHFRLYAEFGPDKNNYYNTTNNDLHLVYEGQTEKNENDLYLYSFTYAGHIDMLYWVGTSATDSNPQDSKKLTGNITSSSDFGEYYADISTRNIGNTATINPSAFANFAVNQGVTEKSQLTFEPSVIDPVDDSNSIYQNYTLANIESKIGVTYSGSLISAPGVTTTVTDVAISGPVGRSGNTTVYLKSSDSTKTVDNYWNPTKAGRYSITYKVSIGTDNRESEGAVFVAQKNINVWVTADEIDIYIDMNSNVGTPTLHFDYYLDGSGNPASSGTKYDLPFELDLVTGSESIYKTTIKQSKLRTDYGIQTRNYGGDADVLRINKITVDNNEYTNNNSGFDIGFDSTLSGEAWFKADSTNLRTFNQIAFNSLTKSFRAAIIGDPSKNVPAGITNVSGTGIITDDESTGIFEDRYAVMEKLEGTNTYAFPKFSYNVHATAAEEATYDVVTGSGDSATTTSSPCYFVKWVVVDTPSDGVLSLSGAQDVSDKEDLHINVAPELEDNDKTYVALYKLISDSDAAVRVEITYNFNDYDTSDGNYIYDENKAVTPATYTKTVKVSAASLGSGLSAYYGAASPTTDQSTAAQSDAKTLASNNLPKIKSRYFNYTFDTAEVKSKDSDKKKIKITATLTEEAHTYHIVFDGTTYNGNFEQTEALTKSVSNPAWWVRYGSGDTWHLVAKGKTTYNARYGASDGLTESDTMYVKVTSNADPGDITGVSIIRTSSSEIKMSGTTEKITHNFYIIDLCEEGDLLGGGLVYATTENENYRTTRAAVNLANTSAITSYIQRILGTSLNASGASYDVEYRAQTIDNTGFRYLPFSQGEDVFRYSDDLAGYHYYYSATNNNSPSYGNQKLRVYSFFVRNNGTIVVSPTYAEVSRYVDQG